MSEPYPKTPNVFLRDPTNPKRVCTNLYSSSDLKSLEETVWVGTEKIDGANIRISWNSEDRSLYIQGRKDNSLLPPGLFETDKFLDIELRLLRSGAWTDYDWTVYAEAYGKGIQKFGSRYSDGVKFLAFSAKVDGGKWFSRRAFMDLTRDLRIPTVPIVRYGSLRDMKEHALVGFESLVSKDPTLQAEGLVIQPVADIYDGHGRPFVFKLKTMDLQNTVLRC